ncbi:MAG TPA: glycosyl hydrolase family 65 protein [Anaerolineales bacterium]|nr:glycosyl hydrolase family 65 protein [Anaerolineales bacterium]
MNYGYFDDRHREYVITNPRTPVKWINYIGNLGFGGFVDHTGGALICKGDPTFNRITKYLQQAPASEFKGESLYLRIHGRDGYRVFSPFFVPTLDPYDLYECHVGLGYTRIVSESYGLRTEVTIFVPSGEAVEIRDIRVSNLTGEAVEVDVVPVVEYTHPNALMQFTNADWVPQTMVSKAEPDGEYTVMVQYPFMNRDSRVNYFTSNLPASSYETDRRRFLGANEYGTWAKPLGLFAERLSGADSLRGDVLSVLLHPLGKLEPGATRRLVTQLGQEASLEAARPGIRKYRDPVAVDSALDELKAYWERYLSILQVQTPDPAMNSILNIHNPHQCYITKNWSRYLSYYQLGMGSRGIGMRDGNQDVLAVLPAIPQEGREFIRRLLSFQKANGSAMHSYNPLSLEGSLGDSTEMEDRPHYYSDDHLWLVLSVCAYIKETGETAFLDEKVPFYDRDKQGQPLEEGTVREHLARALAFTRKDIGRHGLPLLGFADWNDTVNLPSGAESLFSAHLYGRALKEIIGLAEFLGDAAAASEYRAAYVEMQARVEDAAWDGEWYVMYFDQDGNPVGSSKNEKGKLHLNGQSWAVLSGFASPERATRAMDSVEMHLNTRYGIKVSTPGFNGYDRTYGGITTYPPGAKENGGIFLHPNPWAVIAETLLGNGDRAYQYYAQINPAGKNDLIDIYECEPYVYAQNILGDEHPNFGLARNSWLSGTSSWCYQAGTQWILGVRPDYGGLRIDPCIPSGWDGFTVTRRFRGQVYNIVVHNPERVSKGVIRMVVDGKEVSGNLIAPGGVANEHRVEIWLGK